MKKIINNILVLMAVLLMASCAQTEFDVISDEQLMGDSLKTTYTIDSLLKKFNVSTYDAYTDTATYTSTLFTTNKITSTTDVVISGVVTSTDIEGNVYKYLTLQETFNGGRALKISVDAAGLSGFYPLGQRIWVRCNDLYIGNYAQSPLLGYKYTNYTKSKYKISTKTTIYRIEPGRISLPIAKKVIHAYGFPDLTQVKPDTMTIAEIKAAGVKVHSKLVYIKNAFFTGKGANNGVAADITAAEMIFAPSTNGVGYPQSREIQDGTGSLFISTSEYSKFANDPLPTSNYRGDITAIVGFYNDKDKTASTTKTYYQLTLRRISDLGAGFEQYHLSNN